MMQALFTAVGTCNEWKGVTHVQAVRKYSTVRFKSHDPIRRSIYQGVTTSDLDGKLQVLKVEFSISRAYAWFNRSWQCEAQPRKSG